MIQSCQVLRLARSTSVCSNRLGQSYRRQLAAPPGINGILRTPPASSSKDVVNHLQHGRARFLHSTSSVLHIVHKDFEKAKPTAEELNETDDTVPEWQNPLHHNNPEYSKMFPEDFAEGEEMPILPLPPLSTDDPDKVVAPPHIHDLAHEIVNLSLL
jgi:hypothetical protein